MHSKGHFRDASHKGKKEEKKEKQIDSYLNWLREEYGREDGHDERRDPLFALGVAEADAVERDEGDRDERRHPQQRPRREDHPPRQGKLPFLLLPSLRGLWV